MKATKHRSLVALLVAASAPAMFAADPAAAETLSGPAIVIDGDTLEVRGKRIRLFGIDAPELKQECERSGEPWLCGAASAERLRELVVAGPISCSGNERDQYARLLAVCTAGGIQINRTMVAEGWATAFRRYSTDYVAEETAARSAKLGLWDSEFKAPEDFRRAEDAAAPRDVPRPQVRATPTQSGCVIKGNHSRRGERIYHLPGMPYYEQTVAEEMFCSEAQAAAAGYRRSKAQ